MTEVVIRPEIFNEIYKPHLSNMRRTQIFFGGAGSGKSVFIAQRAVVDIMRGGRNYLICRQVARTINRSVFNEVVKVIYDFGVQSLFAVNKSDFTITCNNGYQILFVGLDDTEKLKSITPKKGVLTDIVVDEATEIEKNTIKQLLKRQRGGSDKYPKRLVLLFNPILISHWLYVEYFSTIGWATEQTEYYNDELSIQKTWYIHNKFLTKDDVYDLENEKDNYYYQVYTLGNFGILGGVIFTNWRVEDLSDMKAQWTNRRNGLDFGFSADPAAIVVCHYETKKKTIYIYKELYETGLTNDILAARAKELVYNDRVVCDSSEPKSIQELCNYGLAAAGAVKGKDSVNFGIDWLKQQTIIVDKSCINMQNELQQYHWKKDAGGNSLKIPVDKNNHLIDALRYALENDMSSDNWLVS